MEVREILIANTKDQKRYRIMTGAETLGELQDQITRNENVMVWDKPNKVWLTNPHPININGMSFTEGISNTQLVDRTSQLPMAVNFKGQVTNNLMVLMTNTTKSIRSGAAQKFDRKALYAQIKSFGLEETVKTKFGKNFTMVGSADLAALIDSTNAGINNKKAAIKEAQQELAAGKQKEEKVVNTPAPEEKKEEKKLPDVKSAPHAQTVEWFYDGVKKMVGDNLLNEKDIAVLADLFTELALRLEEEKPKITDDDIEEMMRKARH